MRDSFPFPFVLVNERITAVTGLVNFLIAIPDPFIRRQVLSILESDSKVAISVRRQRVVGQSLPYETCDTSSHNLSCRGNYK